mgnify:CR=1 FL=1
MGLSAFSPPVLLVALFSLATCQKVEFEEPDFCRRYLTAGGVAQPLVRETYPGYKAARFVEQTGGGHDGITVVFLKETRRHTKVLRHNLDQGTTEELYQRREQIHTFAYHTAGHMAFTHDFALFLLSAGEETPIELTQVAGAGMVKWQGDHLLVQTSSHALSQVDQQGQVLQTWDFALDMIDYWADDSTLLISRQDSITAYRLPQAERMWAFSVRPYLAEQGTSVFMSANQLSLAGSYGHEGELSSVFFSTAEGIYQYVVATGEIIQHWSFYDCYVLEPGMSVSPQGNILVTTISSIIDIDSKQFGVLVYRPGGPTEFLLTP